eukprot:scaffold4907_cov122-Isochrysis_galbana.AAC.18
MDSDPQGGELHACSRHVTHLTNSLTSHAHVHTALLEACQSYGPAPDSATRLAPTLVRTVRRRSETTITYPIYFPTRHRHTPDSASLCSSGLLVLLVAPPPSCLRLGNTLPACVHTAH